MARGERDKPDPSVIVADGEKRSTRAKAPTRPYDDVINPDTKSTSTSKRKTSEVTEPIELDSDIDEVPPPKRSKRKPATTTVPISSAEEELSLEDGTPQEQNASTEVTGNSTGTGEQQLSSSTPGTAPVHVQLIPAAIERNNPTADLKHFFSSVYNALNTKGVMAPHWDCTICTKAKASQTRFVKDPSTGRRHLESSHRGAYLKWCDENNFQSMLPKDSKARWAAERASKNLTQTSLNLPAAPLKEVKIPYSDWNLLRAALKWLAKTDQPLSALEDVDFVTMMEIAARAPDGKIKLPDRHTTRQELLNWLGEVLRSIMAHLNSKHCTGQISLTCDAWDAENNDAYFATTAHWIDETMTSSLTIWKLCMALIGFVRLTGSHSGERLGQTLFKVVRRVGIEKRIGHVTCDNASNNDTMMEEFARLMDDWDFLSGERRLWCLAHIINLAVQAFIKTYSKSKHYDPQEPEVHEPSEKGDEVGKVRAITVKACGGSQRKEKFLDAQRQRGIEKPAHLLLDMKVRWSSTFIMTHRAWERHELADDSQHEFSADKYPTLHRGIPALETLHAAWSSRCDNEKYARFRNALTAGIEVIEKYYNLTSNSGVHILAMVLDPASKLSYFREHWSEDEQKEVDTYLRKVFRKRHEKLNATQDSSTMGHSSTQRRRKHLVDHDSDDESQQSSMPATATNIEAWEVEYNKWVQTPTEDIDDEASRVEWWGANSKCIGPTWTSIARDILPIMASSVSSERAFSAGGLTITDQRNRLHGDVVEALQILKSLFKKDNGDAIFKQTHSSALESKLEEAEIEEGEAMKSVKQKEASFILELDVDCDEVLC
ncbi:hat family dimerization domain-containing protein [Moniliophthora roreri MCA 2997]|uniref:Hat family dimerization domain-containing protein n=1 Tax=Moniliophthora roreri (strain MCA 2997) TaxID=1381753 RepID=V2XPG7_MONRO|nr:hat family dimerization domain-containing protein [Moniliophthora roreri MCA 2997]